MRTKEEQMAIASTIIEQLGGHKFIVMTGARDFIASGRDDDLPGVAFRIPGTLTKNRINRVRVLLDHTDTYIVSFWVCRRQKDVHKPSMKLISKHDMIYDDMLQPLFTRETGLTTRL